MKADFPIPTNGPQIGTLGRHSQAPGKGPPCWPFLPPPQGPSKAQDRCSFTQAPCLGPMLYPMSLKCHMWGNQRTRGLSCCSCPWFPDALLTLGSLLHRPGSGPGAPSPRYKAPREVPSSHIQLWDCYQQGQAMEGQQKLVLPFAGVTVTTSLLAPLPTSPRQQSTLTNPPQEEHVHRPALSHWDKLRSSK